MTTAILSAGLKDSFTPSQREHLLKGVEALLAARRGDDDGVADFQDGSHCYVGLCPAIIDGVLVFVMERQQFSAITFYRLNFQGLADLFYAMHLAKLLPSDSPVFEKCFESSLGVGVDGKGLTRGVVGGQGQADVRTKVVSLCYL